MPPKPSALVIRTAGTNCDAELCRAFELSGAAVSLVHLDRLIEDPARIEQSDLIAFPGGFSYGDDVASGRIFAARVRERLYPALRAAAMRGCPMIGVCNGFQVLVQVGLLPGPRMGENWQEASAPPQRVALAHNAGGRFIDQWLRVRTNPDSPCIWTAGLAEAFGDSPKATSKSHIPGTNGAMNGHAAVTASSHADDVMRLPIAHGEGRFVTANADVMRELRAAGQVALEYVDNVNGSQEAVAGICDVSGRIFGLMPHPERYVEWTTHPFWTRLSDEGRRGVTPGLMMFQNAVKAAQSVCAG